MPYRLVKNARNTLRPVVRWRGVRGLGDTCLEYDDSGNCIDTGATSVNLFPGGTLPPNPVLNPVVSTDSSYTTASGAAMIGASAPCAAGYVVGDSAGNCVPIASLATTLANPASAAALGFTPSAAAALTASLNAVKSAIAPTSAIVPVVSTNPFASISPTLLLAAGGLLFVVLLMKKR